MEKPSVSQNDSIHDDIEELVENVGEMVDLNTSTESIETLDEIVGTLDSNMEEEMAHAEETHLNVEVSSDVPAEVDEFLQKRRSKIRTKPAEESLNAPAQATAEQSNDNEVVAELADEVVAELASVEAESVDEVVAELAPAEAESAVEAVIEPSPSEAESAVEAVAELAPAEAESTNEMVAEASAAPENSLASTDVENQTPKKTSTPAGTNMKSTNTDNLGIDALGGLVSDLDSQANQIYSTLDQISQQMMNTGENMQDMGKRIQTVAKQVSIKKE